MSPHGAPVWVFSRHTDRAAASRICSRSMRAGKSIGRMHCIACRPIFYYGLNNYCSHLLSYSVQIINAYSI
jgi:hypothetical protein